IDLIGQLQGLTGAGLHDRGVQPIAIAGASAGSIIAALYWVGYTPMQIRELVVDIFAEKNIDEFFSSTGANQRFTFRQFQPALDKVMGDEKPVGFWARAKALVARPFRRLQPYFQFAWYFRSLKWAWRSRGLFRADGFVTKINQLILRGPRIQVLLDEKKLDGLVTFGDIREATREDSGTRLPPFFLVVTDVAEGDALVINSIEEKY